MIVYAECEFFIPTAHSLKEKRAVLQRMLVRARQKFNISAAEIDHQDVWQRTRLALVTVASSREAADREMQRVLYFLDSNSAWERLETETDYL
ncbi:DUF503 domain-containing protein [Planococcus lenghuensis]|uniref:DUF503 domain-containing protein n=1 Tax=Planococcus lenghuensis TaxID=2213202 RepID=A0A1Q2KZZ2_9BACL|nr:DUF503 family protein [Planococcus lenghuensis]AQQ53716.1 hypothetical protein B0X71_11905 [Planococcus lenghuensis]